MLKYFAQTALLPSGWASDVALDIDAHGKITAIQANASPMGRERLHGPLVPAMPNLHSHSFQRAFAGLAEVASNTADSFWTWRDQMYRLVGQLTPEDVETIAAKLFIETLKGGFGSIAEFHYLHHAIGGQAYADPAELSRRIISAAKTTGIGLTLLPVFYAHSDFGGQAPNAGQARFIHDPEAFLKLLQALETRKDGFKIGLAFHSLRAATPDEMRMILNQHSTHGPIHIHVAEQPREVEACLAWSDKRPVEFLLENFDIDASWCLIHATHMLERERDALAKSGAVAGLCPATEANLGDGIFPAVAYQAAGGRYGIGTDSHIATGVAEELKTLEYGQRLRDFGRNRMAAAGGASTGRSQFDAALKGGAQALGHPGHGIAEGNPADFVVLDAADPFIATAQGDQILDRWIFARGDAVVRDVMVHGKWQIIERRHAQEERIDRAFLQVLKRVAA